jgi:hypothetical protein
LAHQAFSSMFLPFEELSLLVVSAISTDNDTPHSSFPFRFWDFVQVAILQGCTLWVLFYVGLGI